MKNKKVIIAVIVTILVIFATVLIVMFVPKKAEYFYSNDVDSITNITVYNGITGKISAIDSKYYKNVVEYLKNYTFTPDYFGEEPKEDWEYKYMITTDNKTVELMFYDDCAYIDSVKYTYNNSSEVSLKGAWDNLMDSMSDYDRMMSFVGQIKETFSSDEVRAIMGTADGRDWQGWSYYHYGEYRVQVIYRESYFSLTAYKGLREKDDNIIIKMNHDGPPSR